MQPLKTKIFDYSQLEIDFLASADKKLGQAIKRLGKIEREVIPDLFVALEYAMVGQQISVKAVHTIWSRMQKRFIEITPQVFAAATTEEIQQCGLTRRKSSYIKAVAQSVAQGDFTLTELYDLPDDEVIKRLSSLPGIGIWTAEMLLLHSMERPDVVSWGDIAIQRGMMNLYGLTEIRKESFEKYKKRYSPYGSVASIYLWRLSLE